VASLRKWFIRKLNRNGKREEPFLNQVSTSKRTREYQRSDPSKKTCDCGNVAVKYYGGWQCARCLATEAQRVKKEKIIHIQFAFPEPYRVGKI